MSRFNILLFLVCCLFLPILFYTSRKIHPASQFTPSRTNVEVQSSAETSFDQYQEYIIGSLRTSLQEVSWKLTQKAHDDKVLSCSKLIESTKDTRPSAALTASQSAYESAIKLQYALDSTDAHLEEPHLFTMGRHLKTLTVYLEAMLLDPSVYKDTFHELRKQLFPWWFPTSELAYLPWEPRERPKTGIVVTVGKGNFVLAAHSIQTLYDVVKSTLPIQVYYAGDDDLPWKKRKELQSLHPQLETINIHDQFNETVAALGNSGYAMKPFAALASSFEQVVLIDADTVFLQRPDAYFDEHAGLKETGIHYFHDRAFPGRKTTTWIKSLIQGSEPSKTLNESMFWQYELEHQQESGVVFLNKALPSSFMSLLLTASINTQKVRDDVYKNTLGDKETFWIASELSSAPYTFAPNYASIIGNLESDPSRSDPNKTMEMCSAQPLHLDHNGRPFWFNSGLRLEKMIDSKEYVNLTHWMPGSSTTMDDQFEWRFRSHHTFCVKAKPGKWRNLEREGLKGVADDLVEEAKKLDIRFLGHEGGKHNNGD